MIKIELYLNERDLNFLTKMDDFKESYSKIKKKIRENLKFDVNIEEKIGRAEFNMKDYIENLCKTGYLSNKEKFEEELYTALISKTYEEVIKNLEEILEQNFYNNFEHAQNKLKNIYAEFDSYEDFLSNWKSNGIKDKIAEIFNKNFKLMLYDAMDKYFRVYLHMKEKCPEKIYEIKEKLFSKKMEKYEKPDKIKKYIEERTYINMIMPYILSSMEENSIYRIQNEKAEIKISAMTIPQTFADTVAYLIKP